VKGRNVAQIPLTKKQYYNVCIIIKGCLGYALEKDVIKDNVFLRVKVKKKHFYVPEKEFTDDRDQVFNSEEFPELRKLALEEYYEKRDDVALAVFLISFTGIRAAEACALKWTSFNEDFSRLFITAQVVKEEHRDQNGKWKKPKWIYVNYTKSENGRRSIYVPAGIRNILQEHKKYKNPKSDDEMVFSRVGGHYITNNQTYKRTVKYSAKIKTYRKGTHKLRKTYLTTLYDGGVHESTLTKIAGQAMDGKVLHIHYLKDRKSEEDVNKKLDELMRFVP
jgi:integrase